MASFAVTACTIRKEVVSSFITTLVGAAGSGWQLVAWDGQPQGASQAYACALWVLATQNIAFLARVCTAAELLQLGGLLATALVSSPGQSASVEGTTAHSAALELLSDPKFLELRALLRTLVDVLVGGCYAALGRAKATKKLASILRRAEGEVESNSLDLPAKLVC